MSYSDHYSTFKWIKVKRFERKEELSWEDNYNRLERHHQAETEFLIAEVRKLAALLDAQKTDGEVKPTTWISSQKPTSRHRIHAPDPPVEDRSGHILLKFYGGPIDGEEYTGGQPDPANPYRIFPLTNDEGKTISLYACYKFEDDRFIFISTKDKLP